MKRPVEELADIVGTNGRQVPMIVYRLVVGGRATLDVATTTVNDRFRTVLAVFLVAFVATFYALRLWAWDRVQADLLARDAAIVAARPLEVVVIQARIGAGVGVVIAAIAVTYLARDAFVDRDPRTVSLSGRALAGLGGVAICSFVAGVAAAYLGLVPFLLDLVATNAIEAGFAPTYSIATWTSFVLVYSTWIGLGALLPLVMGITTAVGGLRRGLSTAMARRRHRLSFVGTELVDRSVHRLLRRRAGSSLLRGRRRGGDGQLDVARSTPARRRSDDRATPTRGRPPSIV